MMIDSKALKCRLGELVTLGWNTTLLKSGSSKSYSSIENSRYLCIREATKNQRGILVKGLGKIRRDQIMLISGKPFCKDERDELFVGKHYYGYPFPGVKELKEVLDIVRVDMDLQQKLIDNGMFFNPNGTFWVSDTKSQLLGMKHSMLYYAPSTDSLTAAKSADDRHQRLAVVYFDGK